MTFAVRPIARAALPAGVLLAVPLVAMRFTDDVAWSPFDFVFMGALLFGTFLTFDAAARRLASRAQRAAFAAALATAFLLVWVNASVGIIGAPGGPNVLYLGVLAVGPQRFSAPPSAWGVLALNAGFAVAFAAAGLLFARSGAAAPRRA
ncbi:MAG: hypothetical protein ACNA8N_11505 [Trueperaceae bacterium]